MKVGNTSGSVGVEGLVLVGRGGTVAGRGREGLHHEARLRRSELLSLSLPLLLHFLLFSPFSLS